VRAAGIDERYVCVEVAAEKMVARLFLGGGAGKLPARV